MVAEAHRLARQEALGDGVLAVAALLLAVDDWIAQGQPAPVVGLVELRTSMATEGIYWRSATRCARRNAERTPPAFTDNEGAALVDLLGWALSGLAEHG